MGRFARVLAVLMVATLVLGLAAPASAHGRKASQPERRLLALVNQARANHGLERVSMGASMRRAAHRHSHRMANRGRIFHSLCLICDSPRRFRVLAENVGAGPTLRSVHRALMRSPAHRRIILDPRLRRAGMGVVRQGGRVWVTQRYWG